MKGWRRAMAVGGIASAGVSISLALTNPGQQAYENYALKKMTSYLKKHACTQIPKAFNFLHPQCQSSSKSLIESGRPQLQKLICENTERENFFFFSIYRTDLYLPYPLPSYHIETVGGFQNFYIYQAEEL
ncbi:MAG: DUF4359 domain-containing protein [Moorea sp. SIO2B7]|nr:DUF4359 domain-containing protein [Moorena sp. SIO2B7]